MSIGQSAVSQSRLVSVGRSVSVGQCRSVSLSRSVSVGQCRLVSVGHCLSVGVDRSVWINWSLSLSHCCCPKYIRTCYNLSVVEDKVGISSFTGDWDSDICCHVWMLFDSTNVLQLLKVQLDV